MGGTSSCTFTATRISQIPLIPNEDIGTSTHLGISHTPISLFDFSTFSLLIHAPQFSPKEYCIREGDRPTGSIKQAWQYKFMITKRQKYGLYHLDSLDPLNSTCAQAQGNSLQRQCRRLTSAKTFSPLPFRWIRLLSCSTGR